MKNIISILYSNKKFAIIFVSVFSILIFAIGAAYFFIELNHSVKDKQNDLQSISLLKSQQISNWIEERISDSYVISGNNHFQKDVSALIKNPKDKSSLQQIKESLINVKSHYKYLSATVILSQRKKIISTDKNFLEINDTTYKMLANTKLQKQPFMTDFYFCKTHKQVHFDFITPIFLGNDFVGGLILRIDPENFLYPILRSWHIEAKTAKSFIFERSGNNVLFLSDLRFRKNSTFNFRLPLSRKDLPAVQAVLGKRGIYDGPDYRDKDVLAI